MAIRFFEIQQLLQAELLDQELQVARQLAKSQFLRSSGAICGIVLEKHLDGICHIHHVKTSNKSMTIKDYNDLLKKREIYPLKTWRFIQYLAVFRCSAV